MFKERKKHNRIKADVKSGKNNKGYSLVELLIIIGIMAILATGSVYALSAINAGDANKAAKEIYNQLIAVQRNTMSMDGEWSFEVINNNGVNTINVYNKIGDGNRELKNSVKLGSRIDITYNEDGGTPISLSPGEYLTVTFERSTSKLKEVQRKGTNIFSSGVRDLYITATARGKTSGHTVKVVAVTGKIISSN